MKFGIDMGHNCPPHDIGASGVRQEDVVIKEVGTRLIAKLAAAGHSVINCTPTSAVSLNDSLRKRANKANSNNVDIFVSIHFNAFNTKAMGAEVYGISQTSQAIAGSVLTEIVKLGFKNRGVKNTRFSVLVNTSMPAILIECCFVDSQADMALFDAEKMAEAIKVGLIGDAEDNSTPEPATLRITQKTILKPSTEQSSELEASTLVEIEPGDYAVLDVRREERHFFVKWPDKSFGNRDEHFVFEEFAEIV
ncbi:MAG: N-acetylmuramoyl-L-alanine amidase [Microcystis wesenbergii Mw_QC_S_20081001_S30D]|jgi:N-acetylmuramoyl-L-alanine amidase|uniref:N-acetylmuramoyl-L-alanine amidase n=1 Tax=Microcystis wesenbergii Mw_QC_S_20081001_S30D TaxID=2486245 RepID=A0A552JHW5_9CHRO|nr:N-acetylmuramoyl-L-alanine amidase [Microcystis aeruginosa W11-03]NCQ98180.1 N-acetylmuramoyl-L-alanine amidase [Microcystis aeruginosa L211-11]NCR29696.1 N-acetylmuramoyl-L-alanine amidase [Microcystis aeruginosa L211-101]NCR95316.1 N-acetylmuramoyl-L-alanine amidase [Microcystis aeruginosa W11-06]TRU95379.1 MAG: N-acetylmuramoyl-L-alanine amidase [Microcystis wesenbergii Mw_QC_S_20081001_S30D]TRV00757.1 MAG: N-acetylmuramoyl-L-alanine amidase [Microcystis wesenbergii Mw_QC_B_20070930_S4D]